MPDQFHFPLGEIEKTIEESMKLGVNGIILFGISETKDETGTDTVNENGIIQRTVKMIRKSFPELIIITDACFCQYTIHGHCGILNEKGAIDRGTKVETGGRGKTQRQSSSCPHGSLSTHCRILLLLAPSCALAAPSRGDST